MKKVGTVFVLLVLLCMAVAPIVAAAPKHQLQQLQLRYTTTNPDVYDDAVWTPMAGNEISGFKMNLADSVDYYYLDVMKLREIKGADQIPSPGIAFKLLSRTVDDATWDAFWAGKGANSAGDPWQVLLYNIKEGNAPIFALDITEENYGLIDYFSFSVFHEFNTLRIDGDYPSGTYTYYSPYMDWTITITFK